VSEPATAKTLTPVQGDDMPQSLAGLSEGEQVYRDNCASCHNLSGQGLNGLPALQHHPVLDKPTADNVAMAVLQGVWPENGQGMIGFVDSLSDGQVAAVTNYVMQDIGHSQVTISAARVQALRKGGDTSPLMVIARVGMAAAGGVLILGLFWLRKKRAAKR